MKLNDLAKMKHSGATAQAKFVGISYPQDERVRAYCGDCSDCNDCGSDCGRFSAAPNANYLEAMALCAKLPAPAAH